MKFHHLRHTAATIVNDKLHDIDAAKTLLGHKHYNTTGIYIHSSAEKMKAAAIAISEYITETEAYNSDMCQLTKHDITNDEICDALT